MSVRVFYLLIVDCPKVLFFLYILIEGLKKTISFSKFTKIKLKHSAVRSILLISLTICLIFLVLCVFFAKNKKKHILAIFIKLLLSSSLLFKMSYRHIHINCELFVFRGVYSTYVYI